MKNKLIKFYLVAVAVCFSVNIYAETGAGETITLCDGKNNTICKGEVNGIPYNASGNKPS
ncbi:hypothetical protein QF042_003796 [Pedobacter sp. W3I1]|uniref:hypothetical protein n=1 Tax=Pedobacter sp. W3I1 TaxID=3042291 RepID=UPI00278AC60E|nr:hypothetical protein [Pedobacter sp. W3I1]MDQ0640231.1 hypothetical protein [Pedobacter sp. W3I1]